MREPQNPRRFPCWASLNPLHDGRLTRINKSGDRGRVPGIHGRDIDTIDRHRRLGRGGCVDTRLR
jgi:hypothetical protein